MRRRTKALMVGATLAIVAGLMSVPIGAQATQIQQTTPADPGALAASAADRLVAGNATGLHKGPHDVLTRVGVQAGTNGLQYVAYERTHRGLPVIGGDLVVVADARGNVLHTSVAQSSTIDVDTRARVPAAKARATSRAQLAEVDSVSAPRSVVLAWGAPRLAWETVVTGFTESAPSTLHVFVDATTGRVIDSYDEVKAGTGNGYYNGTVNISTASSGSSFSMSDPTRSGIRCGGQNGSTYTGSDNTWGNGSGTSLETACVDALYAVQKQWDMLADWLGRDGINGNGGGFPARVGLNQVNAYWNGSYTNFGHSQDNQRQATPIDVVAHEFGHAIFQTTPGGSGGEENGLNEATGDIFGALTEAYANNANDPPDFLVGEEVNLVGSGPIRNMYNPGALGDPNCYSSAIPNTEVHAAAGPLNHWFYLMSQGSNPAGGPSSPICSGGPSSVTGIGIENAGKVYYNAMLQKNSSWDYVDVRVASLHAANDIFSGCTEFNRVKDAWAAINIGPQSGEPTCTAPSNDFSISVSAASGSVDPGDSTTASVSTATTSGSSQTVNLSASGLPSGATASFSPSSVTSGGSSTMTISTSTSTPPGTYTVTITGTGSSATHDTSYQLGVNGQGGGVPDISVNDVMTHLQQFQTIANNNGGNRRSTGGGYDDSVDYVYDALVAAGYDVVQQACTSGCSAGAGPNVIADWPGGDPDQVLMLGAHLDGVSAGPGINDNGSGSAMLLEVALTLAEQNPTMDQHVRFAWWTDEEQGLNGSQFYANDLSSSERADLVGYLNFDMVGSTNGGYFINRLSSGLGQTLAAYYTSLGVDTDENVEGAGRSDDASFNAIGVETSGVAAGASDIKSSSEASKWGGTAGQSFDPCYHSSCDTYPNNINTTVLDRAGDAAAYAIWTLAVGGPPTGNDFSMSVSPSSATVDAGDSTTATVLTVVTSGGAQTVNLSGAGLPSGATASFSPSSISSGNSSTMTINTTSSTPPGTYPVTITGAGTQATHTSTFTLTVNGGGPAGCSGTNPTDVSIPDNTTVQSTITISGCPSASSSSTVDVHIVHTYIGDLVVDLVAPDGTSYNLHNRSGGSANDIDQTYTVNLSGESANGTWRLRVTDHATFDPGTIDSWTLDLDPATSPGGCTGFPENFSGTVTSGSYDYQPAPSGYFYEPTSGVHEACLDGPDGVDFDLYLDKWNGSGWVQVASSTSPGPDESLSYTGTSGYYSYRIHAWSGSGSYDLGFDTP